MMSFFNPLKDIMDVKLNSYGVQLYASGKFNPIYFIPTDSGMVYEEFELDSDRITFLRENFAFMRPQRDYSFDTTVQNFDYFFESVSPCAIGSVLETVIEDSIRSSVPNMNIRFGSGSVSSAIKTDNIINVTLNDIEIITKEIGVPNESVVDESVFFRNGKFFSFQDNYLFIDVLEDGVEYSKENFWVLLYEKYGEEYRHIDLEECYFSEYGIQTGKTKITQELDVAFDAEIKDVYLCDHAQKANDNSNVYVSNKGTINIDLLGRMCASNRSKTNIKTYINRREKDLGDEC